MLHRHDITVRWSDEDRLAHVNNARYLTFTEDARLSWLAASPSGAGSVILARTEIDFLRQVHFEAGGRLVVLSSVTAIGRTSLRLRQDVFHAGADGGLEARHDTVPDKSPGREPDRSEPVARTENVLVRFDYERQRAQPWQEPELSWLRQFSAEKEAP